MEMNKVRKERGEKERGIKMSENMEKSEGIERERKSQMGLKRNKRDGRSKRVDKTRKWEVSLNLSKTNEYIQNYDMDMYELMRERNI